MSGIRIQHNSVNGQQVHTCSNHKLHLGRVIPICPSPPRFDDPRVAGGPFISSVCCLFLCQREKNLLGIAYNWQGNARPASFDDVQRRHQALPADQLARVTAQYLRQQQAVAAATGTSTSCGGGGDAAAGGSSGTAIVVQEQPPRLTGPGVSKSLLSRVEPFSEDREANEVRARQRVRFN